MALTQTATSLVDAIRKRTDNEGISATDRFPDSEILGYLNRAIYSFWRILVETRAGSYEVGSTTFSTTNGISLYGLDASFYRLLDVNITIDSRKNWLVPFDPNERASLSDTNVGWQGKPFRYSLVGSNIELLPAPTSAYTVEVRFVPDPPTLVLGNSFDCVNGDGLNYLIDAASIFVAEKDENFELAASLRGSVGQLAAALAMSLPNRDQNYPTRIQDVRSVSSSRYGAVRYGRLGR